ncbi:hypothetical protein B4098_1621 [Heyndrickxia coagulans]|uniref:Uncharacterized protein n=1 Tax=Heyndrickxia coagulans TaxID=1398 RepID=A0A150JXL0_HEYCO|nr:hypothetical protein B4098_1621 [Heyndrickxia coagulans]
MSEPKTVKKASAKPKRMPKTKELQMMITVHGWTFGTDAIKIRPATLRAASMARSAILLVSREAVFADFLFSSG